MARNLNKTPVPPAGVEVWLSNNPIGYNVRLPRILESGEWTACFNLHSRAHMESRYPHGVEWYKQQDGSKPLYTQKYWPDLPGCTVFPRREIQAAFPLKDGRPTRYLTCTAPWLIAKAIFDGATHIGLWGFALSDNKPNEAFKYERPCFFHWVQQARDRGIEVIYQQEVADLPFEPGDPDAFTGTLYGFDTRPESDWDPIAQDFVRLDHE